MTGSFIHNDMLIDNYSARLVQWQGQDHLVAPVVLMVPGVHHGSAGPLLYNAEELATFAMAWNGVPVPVGHPQSADGQPLSANDPEVLANWNVGRLFNVFWDEAEQKLRGEVWVNVADAQRISPATLTYLRTGRALEVSTGLFSEHDETPGTFNGEEYSAVVRGVRPDHLALLPGAIGACSVADGCGIRTNTDGAEESMEVKELAIAEVRNFLGNGGWLSRLLSLNERSFEQISRTMQRVLDRMDGDAGIHWLEAIYPERLIFRVEKDGVTRYYESTYEIDADGVGTIGENTTQVVPDFVPVTTNSADEAAATLNQEEEEMKQNRETVVATLRTNGKIAIDDAAADALVNLESCDEFATQIGELISDHAVSGVTANAETAEPDSVAAVIAAAPEAFRSELEAGQKLLANQQEAAAAKHAELVATITGNEANTFTDEQLAAKPVEELESIVALIGNAKQEPAEPNLLGNGGVETDLNTNSEDAPAVMEEPSISRFASQKA